MNIHFNAITLIFFRVKHVSCQHLSCLHRLTRQQI